MQCHSAHAYCRRVVGRGEVGTRCSRGLGTGIHQSRVVVVVVVVGREPGTESRC